MNNIISLLKLSLANIETGLPKTKELEYFDDFYSKYSIKNSVSLFDIEISKLFKIYFSSIDILDFENVSTLVDKFSDFIDKMDNDTFLIVMTITSIIVETNTLDDIINIINSSKATRIKKTLICQKIEKNFNNVTIFDNELYENKKESKSMIKNLMDFLFEKDKTANIIYLCQLLNASNSYGTNNEFLSLVREIVENRDKMKLRFLIYKKKTSNDDFDKFAKMNKEYLKYIYDYKSISEFFDIINKHYDTISTSYKKEQKTLNKLRASYSTLIRKLEIASKQEEITNIDDLLNLSSKLDIDIDNVLLRDIANHNKDYYDRLESKYKKVKSMSGVEYIDIFARHDLDFLSFTKEEQQDIMKIEIEELAKILTLLSSLNIINRSSLYEILINTDSSLLNELYSYTKMGVISSDFLNSHHELCCSITYTKFSNNIDLISRFGINILKLSSCPEVLLYDSSVIQNNLSIIKNYGINIISKNIDNYGFLTDINLVNKIDLIIEIGCESILINNPSILNYDINILKRLMIAKNIGCEYLDEDSFNNIVTSKFFIADKNIDDYLVNATASYLNRDKNISIDADINLDDYQESALSYSFNGVIISKNKVIRNLDELNVDNSNEKIFKAIIKGSILNNDQVCTIIDTLNPKIKHKLYND